ncbi:TonB-dependent receptor [Acanthopleuribacter pedis]|uniref:TonB-dependent receptor n=1 Tax=Acanthopleuribacter pedis TaxID=442870 RepID=A0A8J7QA97_9BACT|nr:TonB-dependent receptor [Acanthopleuribacter pedis]MBO1321691.1 TonB-dependent receptor [Acanthopleuribacter pedis]
MRDFGPFQLVASFVFALSFLPLAAQDTEVSEEFDVLEEITVTARKQEVRLQEAAVAISAVDGIQLDQAAVTKLDDFNSFVPGLHISKNDGAGRVVAIRGVGWETAQNLSTQPGVLIYINGVYLANPLALGLHLGDIERIDVLRGPQGTEYGQSATGGAINIITKKPELGQTNGTLELQIGDYALINGRGRVNVALGDKAALAFSLQSTQRDGFAEISGTELDGYQLDDADSVTGNLALSFQPNSAVSFDLVASWQDSDQNGAAQKHIDDPNRDPRRLTQDSPSTFALENMHLSAVLEWRTPWRFSFKSLTGYQDLEKNQTLDGDRLTSELTSVNLTGFFPANFDYLPYWDNKSKAVSQEFNLTGSGETLDWVVGLYYLDHENDNDFLEAVGPGRVEDFSEVLDNPSPENLPPFQAPLEFVETRVLTREDSAAYGQITKRYGEKTALTLGARYQRDESEDVATQFWFNDSRQVLVDKEWTWKVGLDYRVNADHFLYGLVSTGWKNGGNNPGALNGALQVPVQFAPETLTAFEIGSKNQFLGRRARLNLTAFYYDYEDYQFIQEDPVPFAGGTGNIPAVTIYGFESEFSWLLNDRWRLDGHVAFLDGEIDSDLVTLDTVDFLNSGFGRFTETGVADRASLSVNLRGNTPPKLVEQSGRLRLAYQVPYDNGRFLRFGAEGLYRGEYQYRVFNNPLTDRVPSYSIFNTFAIVETGKIAATLAVTNLGDKDGVNARYSNPFGLHTTSDEFIPPRQITLKVRYNF